MWNTVDAGYFISFKEIPPGNSSHISQWNANYGNANFWHCISECHANEKFIEVISNRLTTWDPVSCHVQYPFSESRLQFETTFGHEVSEKKIRNVEFVLWCMWWKFLHQPPPDWVIDWSVTSHKVSLLDSFYILKHHTGVLTHCSISIDSVTFSWVILK